MLDAGPAACGYEDQCWTLARIADLAWDRFGVEYTRTQLRRMQYRHSLLEGFLAGTRLDLTPFSNPQN